MAWHEPQSMEEYERRMKLAADPARIAKGTGMDTRMEMPCPWCASPAWMVVRIPWAQQDMAKEATCKRCGRSGQNLVLYFSDGGQSAELVQTGGPPAPEWLEPKPRNIAQLKDDPSVDGWQEVERWQQ